MSACRKRKAPGTSGSRSTNSPSRSHASEPAADRRVVLEHVGDERPGERHAEHRRPAQQRAVARRELVDPRRDERLDASRAAPRPRPCCSPALASRWRNSGLPAPRSMSAASSLVGEATVARRGHGTSAFASSAGRGSSRSVRAGSGGVPSAAANPPLDGRLRRAREPRPRRQLRPEVAQQLGRRVVHPVDVVEARAGSASRAGDRAASP